MSWWAARPSFLSPGPQGQMLGLPEVWLSGVVRQPLHAPCTLYPQQQGSQRVGALHHMLLKIQECSLPWPCMFWLHTQLSTCLLKTDVHLCWPLCELFTTFPMNSSLSQRESQSLFLCFEITNFHFIISLPSPINQSYDLLTNLEPIDQIRLKGLLEVKLRETGWIDKCKNIVIRIEAGFLQANPKRLVYLGGFHLALASIWHNRHVSTKGNWQTFNERKLVKKS